jgi:hypothetical protein
MGVPAIGVNEFVIPRAERGVIAALAAQAGMTVQFVLRRCIATGGMLVKDLMQVGFEIAGELQRTGEDGVFDGFLAEIFLGTLLQQREQIIFHISHSFGLV